MMTRKGFIKSHGATCKNWNWSWSFINEKEKFIIFGAWDNLTKENVSLILSEDWQTNDKGQILHGFKEGKEYLELVMHSNYSLKTFPIIYSDERKNDSGFGPSKIGGFEPILSDKSLFFTNGEWYAIDESLDNPDPNFMPNEGKLKEGSSKEITVNAFERNGKAREICINHHGYHCAVCDFDFEKTYGSLGKKYIHVHHIIPISKIKREYEIDPINDLIPVCPNCHAMIHRTLEPLSIEELKLILNKNRN